ncbi:MAG: hypothetical protein H7X80_05715 [bacterium]|nr:hypothetical protein [Candidatus Kapabacteria bacterium]
MLDQPPSRFSRRQWLGICVCGFVVLFLLLPDPASDLTPGFRHLEIRARVIDIEVQRNLVIARTIEHETPLRFVVYPKGEPRMFAAELERGADSIRKAWDSDSVWFLVGREWHGWAILKDVHP